MLGSQNRQRAGSRLLGLALMAWAIIGGLSNVEWSASKMKWLSDVLLHPKPAHTFWVAGIGLAALGAAQVWPRIRPYLPTWLRPAPTTGERLDEIEEHLEAQRGTELALRALARQVHDHGSWLLQMQERTKLIESRMAALEEALHRKRR